MTYEKLPPPMCHNASSSDLSSVKGSYLRAEFNILFGGRFEERSTRRLSAAMAWYWLRSITHSEQPMAQVKIYARRAHLERVRSALSDAIHGVLQDTLGLSADKRFHRFIALEGGDFVHPPDRCQGYTILEIAMFEGRCDATKRACLRRLMAYVPAACGIPVNDLEIVILEAPRASWGIRGNELQLDYEVET